MTVDVTWDGVPLAKAATARAEGGDWFVELEQPMPVGTILMLAGDVQATVQVTRVHEGIGSGMVVRKADGRAPVAGAAEPGSKPEGDKKDKRKRRR